jgi:hypothetical protein
LAENEDNVELLATIVQVFEPRFFEVCPQCNKRVRIVQDAWFCDEHNKVQPNYSYLINTVLDDGSMPEGTIRTVFFRNQAERLLGKNESEMQNFRLNPELFNKVKDEVMGKLIKVIGRVTKNTLFDRLEFTAQLVFTDPNPEVEIKSLQKQIEAEKAK